MATAIYKDGIVYTVDGVGVYVTPLKIKYLREFMAAFESVKGSQTDQEAIDKLCDCVAICMKQFSPDMASKEGVEDNFDLQSLYNIVDIAGGISMGKEDDLEPVANKAKEGGSTWETLDLAKLESEAFLLGIWKDYKELEISLSMPELVATLEAKRDLDYQEKKFFAAIQGVDLDKQSGKNNEWEEMKARVFSGGSSSDPNDIVSFQGATASKAGFGIGMGLDYQDLTKKT
jgi:hypothetical protein